TCSLLCLQRYRPSSVSLLLSFCFRRFGHHPHLHSFPTRRSSDLTPSRCTSRTTSTSPCPSPSAPLSCASSRSARRTWLSTPALRSEEHTSELQSRENLVCRLLLEKKKNKQAPYRATSTPAKHRR